MTDREQPTAAYRVLRRLVEAYALVDRAADRVLRATRMAAEGTLQLGLSSAEKTDLTIRLYSLQARADSTTLFAWEAEWFAGALPAAPARILLAAAGSGRELGWLIDAGYTVDAFEPAAKPAAVLQLRAAGRARAIRGSFADLTAAVLRARPSALQAFGEQRYDAVILGWGSFTHVLAAEERAELIVACDRLTPRGPVLASFWLRSDSETSSRARALGEILGRRVSGWRGVLADAPAGQIFRPHAGFCHEFTCDEIEALAAGTGRKVQWGQYDYPHVTFVKNRS